MQFVPVERSEIPLKAGNEVKLFISNEINIAESVI
jgi:hypothetical protein